MMAKWRIFFLSVLFVAPMNQAEAGFLSAIAKIFKGGDEAVEATKGVAKGTDEVVEATKGADDVATTGVTKSSDELSTKPVEFADETDESLQIVPKEKVESNAVYSKIVTEPVNVLDVSGNLAIEVVETCVQNCPNEDEEKGNAPSNSTSDK